MGQNQHVVPHGDGWAVRGAGNERVTSTHSTQAEAQAAAREIAINQRSEVVIHRPTVKIREKHSTANDFLPPGGCPGGRDPAPAIAILVVAPDQRGDLSLCGMGRARSRFPGRR